MSKNITHDGVVVGIDGQDVHVMIVQHSACAGCHAKGACTASDSKDKIIIAKSRGEAYQIGERVLLVGSNSMAWSALAYAFILPLILSIAIQFIVSGMVSEAMSCLFVLAFLTIYKLILF